MAKAKRKTPAPATNAEIKNDGWANLFTSVGTSRDPLMSSMYSRDSMLSREEVESMYVGDGIGRRIIDVPAEELTRQWLKIDGEEGGDILDAFEEIGLQASITDGLRWARLYGGAIGVLIVDDGNTLEIPLNEKAVRSVEKLHIYDRHQVTWTTSDLVQDPSRKDFGEPEFYNVHPYSVGVGFRVHASRVVKFSGDPLPPRMRAANSWWDASSLQGVVAYIRRWGEAHGYSANIMRDFVQAVMSVKGLTDMLAAGQDELIKKRLDILDMSRSILNTMLIDADAENYEKKSSSIAGLPDLIDRFAEAVSGVTGIPITKLFGRSPGGLNASGDSDIRNYYDMLRSQQEQRLTPVIERIARLVYLSKLGPTRGAEPESWSVCWMPLWQMTDQEVANLRKTVAETDKLYVVDMGAVDPTEIRDSRFASGWTMETSLQEGISMPTAEEMAAAEAALKAPKQPAMPNKAVN